MTRLVLRISRSEIRFLTAGDQEEKNDNVLRMWIGDEVRGRSWLGYDEQCGGGGYRYCGILTPTVGQGPLHSRGHIRCHLISIPSTTFLSVTVILRSSSCLLLRFLCLLAPDQLSLVSSLHYRYCIMQPPIPQVNSSPNHPLSFSSNLLFSVQLNRLF